MEFCELGSVRDAISILDRNLTEPEIATICKYIIKGLGYLHGEGKVHRDIKTDNILLTSRGYPKIGTPRTIFF